MRGLSRQLLLVGCVSLLGACGGGGGNDESIKLSVADKMLEASAFTNEYGVGVIEADFAVSRLPEEGLYIGIRYSQQGIQDVDFFETGETTG